jgi:hypothetical protein
MVYRTRIHYKAEMWDRWQRDESLKFIRFDFGWSLSSNYGQLLSTGGNTPKV